MTKGVGYKSQKIIKSTPSTPYKFLTIEETVKANSIPFPKSLYKKLGFTIYHSKIDETTLTNSLSNMMLSRVRGTLALIPRAYSFDNTYPADIIIDALLKNLLRFSPTEVNELLQTTIINLKESKLIDLFPNHASLSCYLQDWVLKRFEWLDKNISVDRDYRFFNHQKTFDNKVARKIYPELATESNNAPRRKKAYQGRRANFEESFRLISLFFLAIKEAKWKNDTSVTEDLIDLLRSYFKNNNIKCSDKVGTIRKMCLQPQSKYREKAISEISTTGKSAKILLPIDLRDKLPS